MLKLNNEALHITNGVCAAEVIRGAGVGREIISWDDVLHCGPVPDRLALEELSGIRAHYIANQGWMPLVEVLDKFIQRDRMLNRFREFNRIILWFEHDLYDQLQLLQLLDWFSTHKEADSNIALICVDQFLGLMCPEELKKLSGAERSVTSEQFKLAQQAWTAFCAPAPDLWQQLLVRDTSALPFLHSSIIRFLQEYPSCENGLSRTQQTALEAAADGKNTPGAIFEYVQQKEEARFMGDLVFWSILRQFCQSKPKLLSNDGSNECNLSFDSKVLLSLTDAGREILNGNISWLDIHSINRWVGGVHLLPERIWCWDDKEKALMKYSYLK